MASILRQLAPSPAAIRHELSCPRDAVVSSAQASSWSFGAPKFGANLQGENVSCDLKSLVARVSRSGEMALARRATVCMVLPTGYVIFISFWKFLHMALEVCVQSEEFRGCYEFLSTGMQWSCVNWRERMTQTLPPPWVLMLIHFWVGLSLYIIGNMLRENQKKVLPAF